MPYAGQLITYVPLDGHREAHQRMEPRGIEAVFVGFAESHGIIHNTALLIPLEAILTGLGSVKPILTKEFRRRKGVPFCPASRMDPDAKIGPISR